MFIYIYIYICIYVYNAYVCTYTQGHPTRILTGRGMLEMNPRICVAVVRTKHQGTLCAGALLRKSIEVHSGTMSKLGGMVVTNLGMMQVTNLCVMEVTNIGVGSGIWWWELMQMKTMPQG